MITRRSFGRIVAAALAAAALPAVSAAAGSHPVSRKQTMKKAALVKPPRLTAGDTVGLVAPGGHTDAPAIARAIKNIQSLGFHVKLGRNLEAVYGNYGGLPQQRLDDLHAMFADPDVNAIWAIRGGSGCLQLLEHLDYELIRRNPKVLIGYSDITALHLAIQKKVGLVTFHGPVASSTFSDYTTTQLLNVLMHPEDEYTIPMALENSRKAEEEPHYALRTVVPGVCEGPLTGGNLCLVSALVGTEYASNYQGGILFLEEVNEAPYRIDRMLMQLQLSQKFDKAAGVMLGICENCGPQDSDISLTLDETTDQHLKPLKVPAVTGYSFGHIRNQFTLPMGIRARLDTDRQTLTLLEPAVS
ncbi:MULTISPECIES: LD-carboxypeptidase [unclassified Duganella]|uniref:S66 peptidase family protein n=1 Tax=unclassified Duganella TaxID=2636909 RepID=UPI0006FA553C|nr:MULTISPECIES: LD-carboxypeptidase [unclassified Duganella]KQV43038.1 LD-carboxypeptidase [Duganella sp. Root336D2]KRB97166.1 LD-carboxypeptidase [Duganella sp. Root198D2]